MVDNLPEAVADATKSEAMQDAAGTWSSFLAAGCLGSRLLIRCCGCDRFALGLIGCSCEALQTQQDARVVQWRHVCRQFYYDHDQIAKRVVEFFESSKLDQIMYVGLSLLELLVVCLCIG